MKTEKKSRIINTHDFFNMVMKGYLNEMENASEADSREDAGKEKAKQESCSEGKAKHPKQKDKGSRAQDDSN